MEKQKYLYIVLTQTGTFFSKMFGIFTRRPYNHTSLSFDLSLQEMYSFARLSLQETPWDARFIVEHCRKGVYAQKSDTTACVYRLPVSDTQLALARQTVQMFVDNAPKYKYNLLGVVHIWLGIPWERRYRFACSQFVAYVLQKAGCFVFERGYSVIKPGDLQDRLDDIVYEGLLKDYVQIDSLVQ